MPRIPISKRTILEDRGSRAIPTMTSEQGGISCYRGHTLRRLRSRL
jgi:hypothetical protein